MNYDRTRTESEWLSTLQNQRAHNWRAPAKLPKPDRKVPVVLMLIVFAALVVDVVELMGVHL